MFDINNKTSKRYQNPELFEQLAIEYAVGSLQGRARKRFEALMDTHFYLRAVVDAYENKFAHLVELLPDAEPPKKVWNKIEAHIHASTAAQNKEQKVPWWKRSLFKQSFGFAAMTFIVSAVLLFNPMDITTFNSATAYSAVLESDSNESIAFTKIRKSDMKLSIDIIKPVDIDNNMELTLWCHPKGGGMPMKMGTVSKSGKTEIKISKEEWQSMKDVGQLAISIEHKNDKPVRQPTGKVILKGLLSTAG